MENKRVLLISHQLEYTGAPIVLYRMAEWLSEKNTVDLLNLGVSVDNLEDRLNQLNNTRVIKDVVIDFDMYDIIIVNTISVIVTNWMEKNLCQSLANKCILWVHESHSPYYKAKVLEELRLYAVVYDSNYILNIGKSKMPNVSNIHKVIYNTITEDVAYRQLNNRKLRPSFGIHPTDFVFSNLGVLSRIKNQFEIIHAIEHIISQGMRDKLRKVKFLFFTNKRNNLLTEYINGSRYRSYIYEYVLFLPYTSHDQIYQYYAISDAYISCNPREPFGLTLIESMEWYRSQWWISCRVNKEWI